ncbi:MAG: hypothetical protein ACYC5Y_13420 [Symbiobacteriia bacterium]
MSDSAVPELPDVTTIRGKAFDLNDASRADGLVLIGGSAKREAATNSGLLTSWFQSGKPILIVGAADVDLSEVLGFGFRVEDGPSMSSAGLATYVRLYTHDQNGQPLLRQSVAPLADSAAALDSELARELEAATAVTAVERTAGTLSGGSWLPVPGGRVYSFGSYASGSFGRARQVLDFYYLAGAAPTSDAFAVQVQDETVPESGSWTKYLTNSWSPGPSDSQFLLHDYRPSYTPHTSGATVLDRSDFSTQQAAWEVDVARKSKASAAPFRFEPWVSWQVGGGSTALVRDYVSAKFGHGWVSTSISTIDYMFSLKRGDRSGH